MDRYTMRFDPNARADRTDYWIAMDRAAEKAALRKAQAAEAAGDICTNEIIEFEVPEPELQKESC